MPSFAVARQVHIRRDLKDHDTECVDIRWLVEAAIENLRSHVLAIAFAIDVRRSRPRASKTEIANLKNALEINEDVGGLEIQVNEASVVNVLDTKRELQQDLPDTKVVQSALGTIPIVEVPQIAILTEFGLNVKVPLGFPALIEVDDVITSLQSLENLHFLESSFPIARTGEGLLRFLDCPDTRPFRRL